MNSVIAAMPTAIRFGSITAPGTAVNAGIVPPPSGSWPNRRESCSAMMMHADAAHEAGDHRIGHQFHILAELQHAEPDLQDTGEDDGREDQRRVAAKRRIKAGEDDDHRAGRAGDLRAGAAEEGMRRNQRKWRPRGRRSGRRPRLHRRRAPAAGRRCRRSGRRTGRLSCSRGQRRGCARRAQQSAEEDICLDPFCQDPVMPRRYVRPRVRGSGRRNGSRW
jgi:hypothetical protein